MLLLYHLQRCLDIFRPCLFKSHIFQLHVALYIRMPINRLDFSITTSESLSSGNDRDHGCQMCSELKWQSTVYYHINFSHSMKRFPALEVAQRIRIHCSNWQYWPNTHKTSGLKQCSFSAVTLGGKKSTIWNSNFCSISNFNSGKAWSPESIVYVVPAANDHSLPLHSSYGQAMW